MIAIKPVIFLCLLRLILLNQINDRFECLRIIHSEVGEGFAVQGNTLLCYFAHEGRIGHAIFAYSRIDTGDP